MQTEIDELSPVEKRIIAIQTDLKHYRGFVKGLYVYAESRSKIDKNPYAPRVIKFSCIPRSEERVLWTLKNISFQMELLECELAALIKYAAGEVKV